MGWSCCCALQIRRPRSWQSVLAPDILNLGFTAMQEAAQHGAMGEWHACAQASLGPASRNQIGWQMTLAEAVARLRALVSAAWAAHGPQACVVLHAGTLFFSLRTASTANMTAEAASRLAFAPNIEALAQRAVDAIGGPFNGVHLRVGASTPPTCRCARPSAPTLKAHAVGPRVPPLRLPSPAEKDMGLDPTASGQVNGAAV